VRRAARRGGHPVKVLLRAGFSLLLLLLAAGALELWARSRPAPVRWKKSWIQTRAGFGHCYSHDPGDRYPIDLRRKKDPAAWLYAHAFAVALERGQIPPTIAMLQDVARDTPHCIIYSGERQAGFAPRRPRRVLLLGDSFTFGEGLRDDETLGYLLADRFPQHNFVNLGIPGVDAPYVASSLGAALQPAAGGADLAIYFFYPNDAAGLDAAVPPEGVEAKPGQLANAWRDAPGSGLLGWSTLFRSIHANLARRRVTEAYLARLQSYYLSDAGKDGMKRTADALAQMGRVATDRRVELLVVIFPFLYHDLWGGYPLEGAHRWVLKACEAHQLRCVDGHEAFASERSLAGYQLNPADAHPNLAANRKMVEYLEALLKETMDDRGDQSTR